MKTRLAIMIALLALFSALAQAHGETDFQQAQDIIDQQIPCDDLNEEDLEILGDYYMEQIHPGDAHERMDTMMGGEGSQALHDMHVAMGERFYCGTTTTTTQSMMYNPGMMGTMMGSFYPYMGYGFWGMGFGMILVVLFWLAVILLIVWLIRNTGKRKGRRPSSLELLKRRYAKGELSRKEFEKMKKDLK